MVSLRTLVIAQNLPFPTFAGMDLRNWQNINGLVSIGEVGVFGLHSNDPRSNKELRVSLAFWRTSSDSSLTYPLPKKRLAARAWLLDPTGHPSDLYYTEAAAAEIAELMNSFRPHLVVIEGLWLHRYLPLLKNYRCRIVLDLHSVEGAKFQHIGDSTFGGDLQAKIFREILPGRVRVIERQAANAVDQIWVCSKEDACLMREQYQPTPPIRVVVNAVDVDKYEAARTNQCLRPGSVVENQRTLIFPAVFRWEPNAKGAQFLIEEVFPRLTVTFPDCQLLLVGGLPTPYMLAAAQRDPRIVVTGVVADVLPFLAAASVMAVPVFEGGGTRLKILEAFASNVPVVSTKKGAEGLVVQNGKHLLFAESADEFAGALQRVWVEERLGKQLAANGLELVKESYSRSASNQQIARAIDELDLDV